MQEHMLRLICLRLAKWVPIRADIARAYDHKVAACKTSILHKELEDQIQTTIKDPREFNSLA